ncbi:amino acid transporter [Allocatelliglobosispora scoriae]|uniref:Amino acid transporter n=1 Tax=Allocatelliglobosispora scoriae TaxID=643052 RepID=A0A841BNJ7_9ACTN|nr:APC family permease [Allocatelliglobosispora scoriae]MBB5868866.1 amino acid transporter [Allocatelliglobosispora scoriae]
MAQRMANETALRRTLSTPKIVFLVVAAAAPMAAMVGTVPLAFAIGGGPAVPAAFAFAGLTLLCFSVGYAAMSRHIVNTGGFYTYMARGLGRPPAIAGGLVALIAYNAATIGLVGAFGYFAALIGSLHGLTLHWTVWAAIGTALMALLGYRQIEISARLLAILMICEVGILVLLDGAILGDLGGTALPSTSFDPDTFGVAGIGVALMFAFISFIGFESAAQYGEETRNPRRSVPLATYASVVIISVFYTATSWIAVGAVGPDQVSAVAGEQLGELFFGLSFTHLGETATTAMQVLLCTSLFAGVLALHNAANRYLYVLGRERVLPGGLGAVHPRHGSPSRASVVQTLLTVVVVGAFAVAGLDPYLNLSTSMVGLGTLGIVVLQAMAALSIIGFFRRHPERHWWRTVLAPLLGLAGLVVTIVLLVGNYSLISGTDSAIVNGLPWLIVAVAAGGIAYARWMRAARPQRYAELAAAQTPEGGARS